MKNILISLSLFSLFLGTSKPAQAQGNYDFQAQYLRSIDGILNNINENGSILASPSQSEPNYYFDWVRDSSLTMKMVVGLAYDPPTNARLKVKLLQKVDQWLKWEKLRQDNARLVNLGEPRFFVNGNVNLDPWGRPQNDGPAIRALTMMKIATEWRNSGRFQELKTLLFDSKSPSKSLIKTDLDYIANNWQEPSFDLWEEEKGMHYYTLTLQKQALLKGSELAQTMLDNVSSQIYATQAIHIQDFLSGFIDKKTDPNHFIISYGINISNPLPQKRTRLDLAVLLASIQTFDGHFYLPKGTPMSTLVNTIDALKNAFLKEYPINQTEVADDTAASMGIAMGRYPGDVYSGSGFDGGNPWFLATLALAEFYCDTGDFKSAHAQFNRVHKHMGADGALSEQFNHTSGYMQGARDLTWSYTSYVSAYRACFLPKYRKN